MFSRKIKYEFITQIKELKADVISLEKSVLEIKREIKAFKIESKLGYKFDLWIKYSHFGFEYEVCNRFIHVNERLEHQIKYEVKTLGREHTLILTEDELELRVLRSNAENKNK